MTDRIRRLARLEHDRRPADDDRERRRAVIRSMMRDRYAGDTMENLLTELASCDIDEAAAPALMPRLPGLAPTEPQEDYFDCRRLGLVERMQFVQGREDDAEAARIVALARGGGLPMAPAIRKALGPARSLAARS